MKRNILFLSIFLASLFVLLPQPIFSQSTESLTITTYYPAPFGVYRELRLLKNEVHQDILLNSDNSGNPNIEFRYTGSGSTGTPYIDFSNDSASDFDYRFVLASNDDFRFMGGTATFGNNSGNYGNVRAAEFWICSGAVTAP
jgi:hypothetical protein